MEVGTRPTPYYCDDFVTLYHGDCLASPELWADTDVMVTDPPYGMAYESARVPNRTRMPIAGDKDTQARDQVLEIWGDRPAAVFGRWDKPRPEGVKQRLIWSKAPDPGMGNLASPWGNSDEEIYILGTGFHGKRGPNVITCPKPPVANRPDHPTPKPVPLMEHLIERCPPGLIVDPFAGSGATLRAAKNLGRRIIGFEIEEQYCKVIAERMAQEVLF